MGEVTVVTCGPAVNESERKAVAQLKTRLISARPEGEWLLLTNLPFSASHRRQSDEIDILAIGPPGVRVIEVKHWGAAWIRQNAEDVEHEADRVTAKARKVGTTLRRRVVEVGRVDGVFLLTETATKTKGLDEPVRGVPFHTFKSWRDALGYDSPHELSAAQVKALGRGLTPAGRLAADGQLSRIGGYARLRLLTPPEEQFHRIFKATHSSRRDCVTLHLYDWSASDDAKAEQKARREFDALHRLQQHQWAPRIVDSFQPAPGYLGEAAFFTVVEPAAPTIAERASDGSWDTQARLAFARLAVRALGELHRAGGDQPMLHRNLTPATLLVKHDNSPILIGFDHARIPAQATVTPTPQEVVNDPTTAPEVRAQGLAGADQRSDVYSLCACLYTLFDAAADHDVASALARGMAEEPSARSTLSELNAALARLLGERPPAPPAPPVRFWTEEQVVAFEGNSYRIVSRLGSGSIGTTFKVVEVDSSTGEDLGAYVAKAVHREETARQVMQSYRLARSHLRHSGLSTIYQVASDWQDNGFSALMAWIEGEPLSEYIGLLPMLAEDLQESSAEALAIRWLQSACRALDTLHQRGLVHGDVSPCNLIVTGSDVVLTDYDCVTKVGKRPTSPGTVMYCSPSFAEGRVASPSDDIYALAAGFFHMWFEKPPFQHDKTVAKDHGLSWTGVDRDAYPVFARFLDRATAPEFGRRYETAAQALGELVPLKAESLSGPASVEEPRDRDQQIAVTGELDEAGSNRPLGPVEPRTPNHVPWLKSLLQSYPGSPWGNSETRGLDSDFAAETYVETDLEQALREDIEEGHVCLVVLCGNAGDGKTALLQHLADRLDLGIHGRPLSAARILKGRLKDGRTVHINLDGSASWQGRSANDLLDQCFSPFHNGSSEAHVLLLAINDGRLLEWIEDTEEARGQTPLTKALLEQLEDPNVELPSHIRFVNLNHRSLVGHWADGGEFDSSFLERLVDRLYGGRGRAKEIWKPCESCSAQQHCEVYRATRIFAPGDVPGESAERRVRARERLFEALQAVHLRGETHITMRELRAALVYILFGIQYCDDYHDGRDSTTYAERAFAAGSPARQGNLLADLVRYDPGLETHPQVDRRLLARQADGVAVPRFCHLSLESARRRAYFEWTAEDLHQITGDQEALGLAQGADVRLFRDLANKATASGRDIVQRLCKGISRLESLPPQALDRQGVVPLRLTPRTPTETAFWVDKPLANFSLVPADPTAGYGVEHLHREAHLVFRYRDGREDRLRLGADLFHLLLELGDGFQLGDVSTDDTFAQLSIFVQRLVREDHRRALAWNPMREDIVFEISAVANSPRQQLAIQEAAANSSHG